MIPLLWRWEYWGPYGRLDTRIDQFDLCHISASYASYDIKCHIMTNDAYDIKIWHQSNGSILVSKRPSGPQYSHLFNRWWLKNCFKIKKIKNVAEIFSLYKFWQSFVFLGRKRVVWGRTSRPARMLKFYMVTSIPKRNGNSLGANSYQKLVYVTPPYADTLILKQIWFCITKVYWWKESCLKQILSIAEEA